MDSLTFILHSPRRALPSQPLDKPMKLIDGWNFGAPSTLRHRIQNSRAGWRKMGSVARQDRVIVIQRARGDQ